MPGSGAVGKEHFGGPLSNVLGPPLCREHFAGVLDAGGYPGEPEPGLLGKGSRPGSW